ncbi:MAG: hypothetical protein Q8J64_05605 [Thermodesulfovibrionales bacterium]|nr:hypothetical protein [Thermodesulfovibrionales bacterium]
MKTKTITLISLILGISALAYAAGISSHTGYKDMEIKECTSCHKGSGVTPNHGGFWVKEHRLYAEKSPNNCADCHEQSFCLDCHQGGGIYNDLNKSTTGPDYMPRSHRSDFRELHPIKANEEPGSCIRCHDSKRFCSDCHSRFGRSDLRVLSHRRGFSDIEASSGGPKHSTFTEAQCQTCHPGSVLPKHEWAAAHAKEARKNLASCQSCHPEGNVCLKCHSAKTGLRVNPHPKGWGDISGRLKRAGNERSCVKCH